MSMTADLNIKQHPLTIFMVPIVLFLLMGHYSLRVSQKSRHK